MSETLSQDQLRAAPLVGAVWTAMRAAGGPRPPTNDYRLFRGLLHPSLLEALPLPIDENRPAKQTVALAERGKFERPATQSEYAASYAGHPRTRVYESIDARSGGWPKEATRYFMRLAGCPVTCTVYESSGGDVTMGAHVDNWYGAIVQKTGEKEWFFGQDAEVQATPTEVVQPGDVLLLPRGLVHDVGTPDYSVHMGFAFITERQGS
jgi:hypothetical protein